LWRVPVPVPVEEEKINDINDAIKSVIRKSQINGGKWRIITLYPHEDWWHERDSQLTSAADASLWTVWYCRFSCTWESLSELNVILLFSLLGLVKGLNEVCKALDRKQALLCVLAKDCDDTKYKKLIEALAKSNGIPLINVEAKMDLGEWLGHCKYDKEHNPRKVKATSSVAVVEYGEESEALSFVINYIKENSLWTVNSN
jgi:small subunit ribosomal protein S12e